MNSQENRPAANRAATKPGDDFKPNVTPAPDLADQLRRRRTAALRSVPMDDGVRDPIDRFASPPGPSDFGLCRSDLLAEIGQCRKAGWADWELRVRFTDPQQVAA